MADSSHKDNEVCGTSEIPEAEAENPAAARSLLPNPTISSIGLPHSTDAPGISFEDSSGTPSSLPAAELQTANSVESSLHQSAAEGAFAFMNASSQDKAAAVPTSCAVNSAYFDELITTETPADGTQSASAALTRNLAQISGLTVEELLQNPTPQPGSSDFSADERKLIRKKKPVDEVSKAPSPEEIQEMLEAQKKLFDNQLADLGKLLDVQYRLTGINPLAQEVSSSVLGQRAVKKPEESLSPETLRLLRDVYALKDTVTKKELRDLSLLTGASRSQVREFFLGQQARVKRLIQLSTDGVARVDVKVQHLHSQYFPTNTSGMTNLSTSDSVEKLLESMRTEITFTGQSNIVQFLLQADYVPGLRLFLDRGGLRFLSKWLSQAAIEEQTSLVRLILKALFHLPMMHAIPAHVSPLVQTLTKLRFYFATDVGTRARSLIAKWSKLFARTGVGKMLGQAAEPKKLDSAVSTGVPELRQSSTSGISQASGPDKKKLKTDASTDNKSETSKPETSKPQNKPIVVQPNLKGLDMSERPSSSANLRKSLQTIEDPVLANQASKKRLAEHGKEKRRVVLVEEITATNRRVDSRRSSANEKGSRPLSADEIRKAKTRERLLQGSNAKDGGQQIRPKESLPASRSVNNSQAEPPATSNTQLQAPQATGNTHFQAAHGLPSRQEAMQPPSSFVKDVQRGHFQPAHALSGRQDPPPASFAHDAQQQQGHFQAAHQVQQGRQDATGFVHGHFQASHPLPLRQDADAQQVRPPPEVSSVRTRDALPVTHFQAAHAPSSRQDGQAAPLYRPAQPAPVSQFTLEAARSETTALRDKNLESSALPSADNEIKQPPEPDSSEMEIEIEDKLVEEVQGEHPLDSSSKVLIADLLKRVISWSIPPGVFVDPQWSVAAGDESKEKEIQSMRVKREEEEFYSDPDSIPQNPKDPWDEEPDYDDSLTLQVPLEADEQGKDTEFQQVQAPVHHSQPPAASVPSHDPELLAILLRNPALVSELTSGQGLQSLQGFKADVNQTKLAPPPPSQIQQQQQQFMHSQFQRAPGDVYGGQQQQHYFGNANSSIHHPGSNNTFNPAAAAGDVQWKAYQQQQGNQQQYQQQQQQAQERGGGSFGGKGGSSGYGGGGGFHQLGNFVQQGREFNANGLNPQQQQQQQQVWPRVSNSNLSFGPNNNNQGLRPPPPPPPPPSNSVLVDRYHQQQQHQQWFNSSLQQPRPGW